MMFSISVADYVDKLVEAAVQRAGQPSADRTQPLEDLHIPLAAQYPAADKAELVAQKHKRFNSE